MVARRAISYPDNLAESFKKMVIGCVLVTAPISAQASWITAVPGADIHDAQDINGVFSLNYDPDIGDESGANTSVSIPHRTVDASRGIAGHSHWYLLNLSKVSSLILDVDYGAEYIPDALQSAYPEGITDTVLTLRDSGGGVMASNDDHSPENGPVAGAGGSIYHYDSFLQTTVGPGKYYIIVSSFIEQPFTEEDGYILQVSATHPVSGPGSLALLSTGLFILGFIRRRSASQDVS